MSILTVSVIAVGSATFGFLAAALLSGAKRSDRVPTREPVRDTRVLSGPSQN
jgi:hypothetical protein